MVRKMRISRYFFKKECFLSLFFSIQRAYGTLKQNLVKFKYTQVIKYEVKSSQSH